MVAVDYGMEELAELHPLTDLEGYVYCTHCGWEGLGLDPRHGLQLLDKHMNSCIRHTDATITLEDLRTLL